MPQETNMDMEAMLKELQKAQKQAREEAEEQAKFKEEFCIPEEKKSVPLTFPQDSGFDSAEMDLIVQRERFEVERQDKLKAKKVEEDKKKREAQEKGRADMAEWRKYLFYIIKKFRKRDAEIEERKGENQKKEQLRAEAKKQKEESEVGSWEQVLKNVEMKEGGYTGAKDISRMKQVILSRAKDK